ncbi:MAG: helix-turn-helix domain-containing protein [Curvibacter sp.]|nr:helix-turn-helix domain-containing protein [Curvibacter sp.]
MSPADDHPAILVRSTESHDIDLHTQQLQNWDLRYEQLDCGRFEGAFSEVRWPGMQIFIERTTRRIRQRGMLPADACGAGILLEGQGPVCLNGQQSDRGTLIACDAAELDLCTPADCTLAGMVIDGPLLREATRRLSDLDALLQPGALLAMKPPEASLAPWRTLLTQSVQTVSRQPALMDDDGFRQRLQDDLLYSLISAMEGAHRAQRIYPCDRRKRIVDRACELILSRPDAPPTMLEVCDQVGASPRKLGYCFNEVLGLSPARYIKAVRLNAVRRELSHGEAAGCSVYDVAARWGFWHFGHFSADYKRQFAELPSETLRRGRLRQTPPVRH